MPDPYAMKPESSTAQSRMAALTRANRQLRRDVVRHISAGAVQKKRSDRYARLLKESRALQQDLRRVTHQMLRAQENQRRHLSRELQDVIAQTLLGIHAKLMALRRGSQATRKSLTGGIASTQKMVKTSVKNVEKATKGLEQP